VFERCYGDQGSSKSQRATRGDAGIGVCPASSFKPTSENFPSRDCLESSSTDRMERFLVAQSVEKEAFHPVPRARGITKWSLSGVSRQSLQRLSGKCWANLMVAYALHYGEQEIPY
jgi:hypothetical protein